MVNPSIYVLCIKQFWALVSVKKTNDVVNLQALIDRKKVVITDDTIRQALQLDDADGVDCLSNEEIFTELARMGYEKPPPKLTFYKAFFSAQWKFLIHTIVQCMSAKKTAWNDFSSFMASAVICLATVMINAQIDDLSLHNTKYTSPAPTQKVFANMKRIGKGFPRVETPLFDTMLVQPQVQDAAKVEEDEDNNKVPVAPSPPSPAHASSSPPQKHIPSPPLAQPTPPSSPPQQQPTQTVDTLESLMTLLNTLMETCATLTQKVANLEQDKVAQALEFVKLKQRVRKLEKKRRSKSSGLKRRMHPNKGKIAELDADEDVTLVDVDTAVGMDADTQGKMEEDVTAVKEVNAAEPIVFDDEEEIKQAAAKERQEKEDLERAKVLQQQYDQKQENIDWNVVAEQMQEKHLDNIKKYQSLKRKPISVRPIFEREYNHVQTFLKLDVDEEPTKKRAAKETLLQESFKKLRVEVKVSSSSSTQQDTPTVDPTEISKEYVQNMLQIVLMAEFKVKALQVKYPLIDWEIYSEGLRTYWRVIRVGGIIQAFQRFEDMLKDFDREDFDALWRIKKEKFSTAMPTHVKEKALWAELTRLYEPNADDVFCKLQRYMHYPIMWKLHPNYEVHQVSSTTKRYDIYMLAEKDYPLLNQVMTLLLSSILQVKEDSEVARYLVMKIFLKANQAKSKSLDTSSN
nr:hypothetical protein [Tanacetum cinerariifolium]